MPDLEKEEKEENVDEISKLNSQFRNRRARRFL